MTSPNLLHRCVFVCHMLTDPYANVLKAKHDNLHRYNWLLCIYTGLQVACIDLIDDLQVSWQYLLYHGHWPALQGLRQQSMVGVGKGLGADCPGLLPANLLEVHEDTHQLCDGHGRVSVIQLNGNLEGTCGCVRERVRGREGERECVCVFENLCVCVSIHCECIYPLLSYCTYTGADAEL